MTFKFDLELGQKYEKEFIKYKRWDERKIKYITTQDKGKFKEYDVASLDDDGNIFFKYEVKCDRIAYTTSNIAIEFECNGVKSGINATKADYYVYYVIKPNDKYDMYFISTNKLKKLIESKEYKRIVNGGDNGLSKMYLFDSSVFERHKRI
jgi:hypothetical protein